VALFEQAAGWLRRNRVLLPGVTVLARQVAAARETAEAACTRLWAFIEYGRIAKTLHLLALVDPLTAATSGG
jgi:hypothetical protein